MKSSVTPSQPGISSGAHAARHIRSLADAAVFDMGLARIARLILAALTFAVLLTFPAAAAETINSFATHVVLQADGTVTVTETIEVTSEGDRIRRGIFRDIPTTLRNPDGSLLRSDLDVQTVMRDGRAEPYAVENLEAGFQRIRIGDAGVLLSHGVHRYTIRYSMTRMGRSFEDHAELYWNATGNYWDFPILAAVASVTLPPGAVISDLRAFTGRAGSTEQDVTITRTGDTTATFRANRALAPGEGLTIAAAFQTGILVEPEGLRQVGWWLSDHRDVVFPSIAILLVLLYYFVAWSSVGRDPQKGTIIPLFHPPKKFSPALVHYVHKMGWANNGWTAFTASIFDLGVKGLVRIDNPGKSLTVKVTGQEPEAPLPPGQRVIFDFLRSRGTVRVDTTTGPLLERTRGEFVQRLEGENRQVYFRNNAVYVVLGFAFSVLCLGAMLLLDVLAPVFLIIAVVAGVAIGLFTSLFSGLWRGSKIARFIIVVWIAMAGINTIGGLAGVATSFRFDTGLLAAISIVIVNIVFAILMRAPTVQGRKVMDQIEGFRMYLETAEQNRLNIENEPPMTVRRFEAILPYAIALGVEKPWSEHFQGELSRNAVADAPADYRPSWYSGRNWSPSSANFGSTASAVASGMSAAMIAAQPASSSSSGFSGGGGGGSSGGGGGGGGGGGW